MQKILLAALLGAGWCGAATLYVAPQGNDAWSGLAVKAGAAGEGPLASLDGARQRVRALRVAGTCAPGEVVDVVFAAGEYALSAPVVFTQEDSCVHYRAAAGAQVSFSGGRPLGAFKAGPGGLWQAAIPRGLTFEQLYVNGSRVQRAKSPNEFYFYMYEPVAYGTDPATGKAEEDLTRRAFKADPKDLKGLEGLSAADLSQVVLRVYHSWEVSQARLQAVDTKSGLVVGTGSSPWNYFFWKPYLPRYVLENYRAALDMPGEWYADFTAGTLLYMPRPGEKIAEAKAVAPVTEKFLLFQGNALADNWVRDIRFDGMSFQYAAYRLPPQGQGDGQAAVSQPAAIEADGCQGLVFHGCEVLHTGAHGIHLRKGCRDCEISRCRIADLGGGAVYVGDSSWSKQEIPDRLTGRINVDNNILQDGGHIFPGAIGVWIGHAADVALTHNEISDFYYTGVSMGWTWGYAETPTRRNTIAFNHIHHVGQGVLNDMGAIYTLGNQEGAAVSNNRIHDVWSYDYTGRGGWGLYTDEGSAGLVFENNLVYRVKTGCVHQHYGKENIFRNNIFAFSLNGQIQRSRVEDHTTIIVTNNIIYWDNDTAAVWRGYVAVNAPVKDMVFDRNIYWNTLGMSPAMFQGRSWEEWRKEGQDVHSLYADPLFKNPENGDFTLSPSSPAIAAGFRSFDPSLAGVYGDDAWKRLAAAFPHAPLCFAPIPPLLSFKNVETDFEEIPVGKSWACLQLNTEGKGDSIHVTDRVAYHGKKSLQVQDAPGLQFGFNPHFILSGVHKNGWIENRFAIRLDKGSKMFCEWRDYITQSAQSYNRGPSFSYADGKLFVSARVKMPNGTVQGVHEQVAAIPADTWAEFVVRCLVGGDQPDGAVWTLEVKVPGAPAVTKSYLAADTTFKLVDWLGFGSDATTAVSFYVDSFAFGEK